jgi:hypothetical protein
LGRGKIWKGVDAPRSEGRRSRRADSDSRSRRRRRRRRRMGRRLLLHGGLRYGREHSSQ